MHKRTLTVCAVLGLCGLADGAAVSFPDFSDTTGLTLNGNATTVTTVDGTVMRLVPATTSQSGSVFNSVTINASDFSTAFTFRITGAGGFSNSLNIPSGADGIVFVIQPVSASIGGAGGGLGYQGISPSVGVEFDTWNNTEYSDPSSNHLGVNTNGSMISLATLNVGTRFDDGNLWYAWIDYNGTTLEVRANQTGVYPAIPLLSYNIDLPDIISTNTAYVGFTAGTGASYGNHDIVSWSYKDSYQPPVVPLPAAVWGGLGLLSAMVIRRCRTRNVRGGIRS